MAFGQLNWFRSYFYCVWLLLVISYEYILLACLIFILVADFKVLVQSDYKWGLHKETKCSYRWIWIVLNVILILTSLDQNRSKRSMSHQRFDIFIVPVYFRAWKSCTGCFRTFLAKFWLFWDITRIVTYFTNIWGMRH